MRWPVVLRYILLVLLCLHISVFLYMRTREISHQIVEKSSVPVDSPATFSNSSHSHAQSYFKEKYPALDPTKYGDLWTFPLKEFRIPVKKMERLSDNRCADVFGARFTTYCERTSELMVRRMLGGKNINHNNKNDDTLLSYREDFLLEYCPCFPSTLIGRQNISADLPDRSVNTEKTNSTREPSQPIDMEPVLPGGRWAPKDCRARQRVAVIIPFRDRHSHLDKLLSHLHPMLQRQQIDYTIFVIEQNKPTDIFNKAMLMNSGFTAIHGPDGIPRDSQYEPYNTSDGNTNRTSSFRLPKIYSDEVVTSVPGKKPELSTIKAASLTQTGANNAVKNMKATRLKRSSERNVRNSDAGPTLWGSFDCFIFHDVDMVPEDDRNIYSCTKSPRHVGVYINKYNYTRCCGALFGGATAFTPLHFISVNGYSNEYYGWGGEDDDMLFRLRWRKISLISYPRCVSRYTMIKHERDKQNSENPNRVIAVESRPEVYKQVGLSSVTYDLAKAELRPLYTWLLFDLPDSIQLPDGSIVPRFERTKDGKIVRIA